MAEEGALYFQDCQAFCIPLLLTMVVVVAAAGSALRLPRLGRPPDLFPPLRLVISSAGGGGDGGGNTRSGHGVLFAGTVISSGESNSHL